jgi:RHS repeat-associated protein
MLPGRRHHRRSVLVLVAVLPLAAGLSLQPVTMAQAAGHAPAPPAAKPVPVSVVHGHAAKVAVMRPWQRPPTAWPAVGSATVSLPAVTAARARPASTTAALATPGTGAVRAGSLPVWASRATQAGATSVQGTAAGAPAVSPASGGGSPVSRVNIAMASQRTASAAGVRGVVFTVARADDGASAGQVHVSLDYASFADAYGAGYAARLRLVELPYCALTTPQVAACRKQAPLASADDVKGSDLGADVTVPGRPSAAAALTALPAAVVVAATSTPSGSAGDFTATALSEAGQWSSGGVDGSFDYSYPIQVPSVPGGLTPDVSLGYDSQSVDGLTSSTNNEASWVGDGWDYSPGFIERDYQSCETEPPGATNWQKSADFCWSSNDEVTLSLNGQDTTLVQDSSTGGWHPEVDNGEQVAYKTGTSNGTHDGGYWVITEQDGTSYYFGLSQLPGYASGDAATNSTWTTPVYATSSGQPCYNVTFASSYCAQAWRWSLDYVTDPHGDAMAYFYNTETNYYARDNGTTASTSYVQGGALAKIEYGLRAGSVYGTTPGAQVNFTTSTSRTDIPADLSCSSGASCDVVSPTFWDKYELTTISTQVLSGSSLKTVDSWALAHSYPATGDTTSPPSLWLSSITRTGEDGTAVSLPPVSFAGTALPNRIESQAELNDGYSIVTRLRLTSVTNETGGVTTVNYLAPSGGCTSGSLPAPDVNTLLCYPDYWTPPGDSAPVLDWFNKYAVAEVSAQDITGDGPPVVTTYSYGGAAWHYDDDALTRSKDRTWDQWRGFHTVTTETGPATAPDTKTVDTFFQGMNGDYQSGGGTSSVALTSTQGDAVTDSDQFAGIGFEHVVDNGPSGAMVSDAITIPWTSAATASQSQPSPLPALTAHMTGTAQTKTYTALTSGGNREAAVTYTHDSHGRVTSTSSVPDTSAPSEDTCSTTTYASNTSEWLLSLPAEATVVSVPCGTAPTLPQDAVSDTLTFYDGATSLSSDTPTAGNVTQTREATSYSGSTPAYTTESTSTYDEYGRVLTGTDADNRKTSTAYTPATGTPPTSVSVTDPMGLVTTTTYDPERNLPLTMKSPAGLVTTEEYDAIGRLTAAWTPGHATTGNPQYKFSYDVSNSAPSVVTTQTLEPDGTDYLASEALYDSLGRSRETQAETADGNTDVSDTTYNADGWQVKVSSPYYVKGAPTSSLVAAADDEVPSQTVYVHDGTGRVTADQSFSLATETWETDTAYGGDNATTTYQNKKPGEPVGGTPQTVFTNGAGQTSAIYQYHSGVAASPSDPASDYDATSYTYTPAGKLATITDAVGNTWSYGYNLAGNQVSETDPDAGTSTITYDAMGQPLTTTDARQDTTSYAYDSDGRKTAEYDTTGGALQTASDELASWSYDTLAKGQITSSTAYYNGAAYTERVIGYNGYGESDGTETIIPSAQGKLAGTYVQEFKTFNAFDDLPESYEDSAAGGLPQEIVTEGYDNAGDPTSLAGTWSYVDTLSYTELGQPAEYQMGPSAEPAWVVDSYDEQTGALTGQLAQAGATPVTVDDQHYTYDNTGQVTSDADTPSGGPAQVQCFQYDYLGRLSQAWSQGTTACSGGPSRQAESAATAPYWEQFSYNGENDMTSETSTPASGSATTTTDAYPHGGSAQPHAVSSQSVSGPSGTTASSFSYNVAGDLTSVSGSRSQSLTWDGAGRLSQATSSAGTTSYLYDADGDLLIRQDPSSSTLYLSDEEITLNDSTSALSGVRYYGLGGQQVALRTSAGQVEYLAGDTEGTQTIAIDSETLAVTRRYYDPYGTSVGATAPTWPGDKSFQNGSGDSSTGLEDIGAREYDAGTASFISPDPLLDASNPQDLNPYAYAGDAPPTDEDPSGAMLCDGSGRCGSPQSFQRGGANYNRQDAGSSYNPHDTALYEESHPAGRTSAGDSDRIVELSPHVYAAANLPKAHALRVAYQSISRQYRSLDEFSRWRLVCFWYHSLCSGQFGAAFNNGGLPNYNTEYDWGRGLDMVATSAGVVPVFSDPVYQFLAGLVRKSLARWNDGVLNFSEEQQADIDKTPSKYNTYKGDVLDGDVKEQVKVLAREGDPTAMDLIESERYQRAVDFDYMGTEPGTVPWYDLTTRVQWEEHALKYGPRWGEGRGIFWDEIQTEPGLGAGGDGGDAAVGGE